MAEGNVTSRADAKAHIASIRQNKGLLDDKPCGPNVADLENALTTLSEQLYQSSTHFLLELIQNADDNTYAEDVQPSVHFTYKNGGLRVDCNEIGFSSRNVEALCRVGQSTKKGEAKAKGYVGEKGIGFKSVFKAADVVWVSSGFYSFKFDKGEPLGMIAPIWAEFPQPIKHGVTSLYLQLCNGYNTDGLLQELKALDSRLLIFLRRLRSITVNIVRPLHTFKGSFSRTEVGKDLIRLTENNKHCDYIIKRHRVLDMPQDKRRDGIKSSEIVLGFPITSDGKNCVPKRESQQVYAFLPIRDYGFEFLIQADFLLIASREDIDSSAEWNLVLRKGLTSAFIDAMRDFNNGELRYVWSRWFPTRAPLESFLRPFHLELQQQIKVSKLLFAHSSDVTAPSALSYVPEKYLFNGAPLTTSTRTSGSYLSGRYSEEDTEYLEALGISKMSENSFFYEFTSMLLNSHGEFTTKSTAWHSHLAGILIRMSNTYSEQLNTLNIVPLNNGTWVSSYGRQILFPATNAAFALPGGLELEVVDGTAAADPSRRKLLKFMGVGELEQEPVVQHIQDLHRNGRASYGIISRAALVSQIEFLYTSQFRNPTFERFWFTSQSGKRLHGSQLYQHSLKPYSATTYFAKNSKFHFIHKDYLAAAGKSGEAWSCWLEERMEVATIPRLVEQTTDRGFKISEDFEFIIKTCKSSDVLLLLRAHWDKYIKFFDPDQATRWSNDPSMVLYDPVKYISSVNRLKQKLGAMLVTCKDGKTHRLDSTYLPCRELLTASNDVPFVEIPDPDNAAWKDFSTLGVSIKVDIHFHLRSLEKLSGSKSEKVWDKVLMMMDTIQHRCYDEIEAAAVKQFFGSANAIYLPATANGGPAEWVPFHKCRWNGPSIDRGEKSNESADFRTFKPLKHVYPSQHQLFCNVLGMRDANLIDLVQESKAFRAGDSLTHVTSIFKTMSKLMEEDNYKSFRTYIKSDLNKIFPVSKNWKTDTDLVSDIQNMSKSSEWFIADTAPLRTTFAGVVPLLDVKVDDLASIEQFLQELGLTNRFLRCQARSEAKTNGTVQLDENLTNLFKSKVDFIIRLIPTTKHLRAKRRTVIKQLRNLEVYIADEVVQEWSVWFKKKWVFGPAGNGQVAFVGNENGLKIYLAAKGGCEMDQIPTELVDEMFNFCGMQQNQPKHSELCLHIALSQHDLARVSRTFSDKGIPTLESLKFADADETIVGDSLKEDVTESREKGWKGWKGKDFQTETSGATFTVKGAGSGIKPPKRRVRILGEEYSRRKAAGLAAAAIVLSPILIPFGIAYGIGKAVQEAKHFDDKNDGGHAGQKADTAAESKRKAAAKSKKSKPEKVNSPKTGPSGREKFENSMFRGLLRLQQVVCPSACNEDVAFLGELAVHKALGETFGQSYNATQHWTSSRRIRANFPAFSGDEANHPTFKFADTGGTFTQMLAKTEYPEAKNWTSRPPTYHIDVKSSTGGLRADFTISPVEFQRARELSVMVQQIKGEEGTVPTDVYILARVYDVDTKAKQAKDAKGKAKEKVECKTVFLVDPWEYYHADRLLLKHSGSLVGSII